MHRISRPYEYSDLFAICPESSRQRHSARLLQFSTIGHLCGVPMHLGHGAIDRPQLQQLDCDCDFRRSIHGTSPKTICRAAHIWRNRRLYSGARLAPVRYIRYSYWPKPSQIRQHDHLDECHHCKLCPWLQCPHAMRMILTLFLVYPLVSGHPCSPAPHFLAAL